MGSDSSSKELASSSKGRRRARPTWIPVVTALIRQNGQILLGQRPEGGSFAGVWEFPGGKIESGESPQQALHRELQEELGIDAEVGDVKLVATHQYGDTGIILIFFLVNYWKGQIKPVHHPQIRWVKPEELKQIDLPEANMKVLHQILAVL